MSAPSSSTPAPGPGLVLHAWSVREPADLAALAPAPGAREPLFRPRTEAEWDWAFRRNPAGTRLFLARRDGRTLAARAALPVRTRFLGEVRTFAQFLDAGLTPASPVGAELEAWLACARALHDTHLVPAGDLVHYGWPGERERALGRSELEHERLRVQSLLLAEPGPAGGVPRAGLVELARFGAEADELYGCCATHWNASAVRDAAFLNWRFVEHPRHRHRITGFQSGATLRGYAVQRTGHELGPRLALLLDWLVLPGDEEAAEALLADALAGARASGAEALAASFPEWSPWSLWFQERGFLHHASEHVLVLRGAVPRYDMLWLRDNWWTTLADALDL